jgi:hypothetical protein
MDSSTDDGFVGKVALRRMLPTNSVAAGEIPQLENRGEREASGGRLSALGERPDERHQREQDGGLAAQHHDAVRTPPRGSSSPVARRTSDGIAPLE